MVGLIGFFLRLRGSSLGQIGLRPFRQWRWIGLSLLFGIVTFFVMLLVTALLVRLFPFRVKGADVVVEYTNL